MKKLGLAIGVFTVSMCAFAQEHAFKFKANQESHAYYEGLVKVSGQLEIAKDEYGTWACMHVDQPSASKIPRPKGDERNAWFCFSNPKTLIQQLALPLNKSVCGYTGKTTLWIEDYQRNLAQNDDTDYSTFSRLVQKGKYKATTCDELAEAEF